MAKGVYVNRLVRKNDIPGIGVAEIEESNLEILNRLMKLEDDIFGEEAVDEWFIVSNIRHGNVLMLVDLENRKVIGICILMRDWDELDKCYLADFGVKDTRRGRGLGTYFLSVVLGELKKQNFKRVSLTVDTENKVAIHLYEKFGFKIKEERKNLYGEGRHRYIMELDSLDKAPGPLAALSAKK